jgi:hypothetical protein
VSEKRQEVYIAALLAIAFLTRVMSERKDYLGHSLLIVSWDFNLFWDAPRGDLEMPVA